MKIDYNKVKSIVDKNHCLKKYNDTFFLFKKISYHIGNFKRIYPETIKQQMDMNLKIAEKGNEILINQITKITGLNEGKLLESLKKLNVNITRQNINEPIFYEFDTILIDTKRIIEFYIKILAAITKYREPDSISNFFKGLKLQTSNISYFCKYLNDNYPKYSKYLIDSWNNWIKDVNEYRYKSIHKSIKIEPKTTVTSHYDKDKKPEKIQISEIKFKDISIPKYIVDLWNNLSKFLQTGFSFIEKNF